MKRTLISLAILSTFIISTGSFAVKPSTDTATQTTVNDTNPDVLKLSLDPTHTYVLWHINHFGFSEQAGKWYASGTLMLDKKDMQKTQLDVTINIDDVITGIPELDKHLKGESFFNSKAYPKATFVSEKVTSTGKDTADVTGILTLHGVSKPVTLKVKLNKEGLNPITQKLTFGFSATTSINRSDFGIKAYVPGLSDKVDIDINSEAYQAE